VIGGRSKAVFARRHREEQGYEKEARGMRTQTVRRISLALVFLCCVQSSIRVAGQRESGSSLRPEHKTVVENWLKLRTDLRLATESDNTNKGGLAATRRDRGRNYQPYYVVGDFNGDKREDFAIALVKRKKSEWPFVFAIFNGPTARAAKPAFSVDADLSDGGIFFNPQNPPREFRLAFGTFESDNCVIVSPRRQSYVTRPCLDE
jgi:hypothetical protein